MCCAGFSGTSAELHEDYEEDEEDDDDEMDPPQQTAMLAQASEENSVNVGRFMPPGGSGPNEAGVRFSEYLDMSGSHFHVPYT